MNKEEIVKQTNEDIKASAKPVILKELELGKGEIYLGELKNKDKFQILARHLTVIEQSLQANGNRETLLLTNILLTLKEIAKKQGINIDKILNE